MDKNSKSRILDRYLKIHKDKIKRLSVEAGEYENRILDVLCSPYNIFIDRVAGAGKVIDNRIIMHNGLEIMEDSYYPELISPMLQLNKGVHEPEEEAYFSRILDLVNGDNPVMIELGSYWAFYSMWFLQQNKNGRSYMVEPDEDRMDAGKKNFLLNGYSGNWIQAAVGAEALSIDKFVSDESISHIAILHSDIQGAEVQMLEGAHNTLKEKMIDFLFVSTHSNLLHEECLRLIRDKEYFIVFESDMDTSSCYDGIIVAASREIDIEW